ncbi:hypothetical protein Ana3638_22325 [Anaerocolumna sedimenticola]|uniref:Uncharacterized protein n=1 Tax=Anaerocolumna sedimenticola TaxID=2696063 RepID=A0A6P1TT96_9FIRM|nr:hypothetical protein [Anaerocolumna sedimenticola]QHQ63171.1 hypothetical protein Ana3638_22325 [Anaerocolumna sedimenticola]
MGHSVSNDRTGKDQNYYSLQYTLDTFKALVDAIIPRTPGLAEEYGKIQYYGALNLHIDEYMVYTLNFYSIPLAEPTALMLDLAADQLVFNGGNTRLLDFARFPVGGTFAALAPIDRFRALTLLEQLKVYILDLPKPFKGNSGLALTITGDLSRYTMMGYYSEWSGYGSTRLESPDNRKLEFYPLSWEQVGYPGPSLGYRALRNEYTQVSQVF